MKKLFYSLLFLLPLFSYSQKVLKGQVVDEKNKPVPYASVFLSNTSIGTTANEQGKFELSVPNGKYDLIISSIGYETYNQTIIAAELTDYLLIRLRSKAQELETVTIEPYEKNGWEKWGRFFLENFIGTSSYAADCKIKNSSVIRFRNSKKNNELTAYAYEPLIIENKALGYKIRYQLESFSYNFKTKFLFYQGYPFFQQMDGNSNKHKRWERKRKEVYYGSMMHFMRSLYRNKIIEEGFEVRHLKKVPNPEKQRAKEAYKKELSASRPDSVRAITIGNEKKDSTEYYSTALNEDDYINIVEKKILPGDSMAYAMDSVTAAFDFTNYLLINYKNKIAPPEYRQSYPKSSSAMMSEVILINQTPIGIQANGSYYNPADLLSLGYWAWSEKIATMLPFDYMPPK